MTGRGALVTAAAALAVAGAVLGITLALRSPGEPAGPGGSSGGSASSPVQPRPTATVWNTAQMSAARGITISAPPP